LLGDRRTSASSAHIYSFLAKRKRALDKMIALEVSSKLKEGRILDVGTGQVTSR